MCLKVFAYKTVFSYIWGNSEINRTIVNIQLDGSFDPIISASSDKVEGGKF